MSSTSKDIKQLEEVDLEHPLVRAFITLNREMGMVQGELKWIKVLMCGTVIGVFGQLLYTIFGV